MKLYEAKQIIENCRIQFLRRNQKSRAGYSETSHPFNTDYQRHVRRTKKTNYYQQL